MDKLLRRSLAPISERAWRHIDEEARDALQTQLSGRSVVDVDGPRGWQEAAVNTGRLQIDSDSDIEGVNWAMREVKPLLELRVPFKLKQSEIDYITRGAMDAKLDAVHEAARKIAAFEETIIYRGFRSADIEGIAETAEGAVETVSESPEDIVHQAAEGVRQLQEAGVGGPYALVLPAGPYHELMHWTRTGFPLARALDEVLHGEIHWSPGLDTGLVISLRGGDYQLTLGHDLAIGYASHDRDEVELYITESLQFRVLDGAAAIRIPVASPERSRHDELVEPIVAPSG